MPKIEWKGGKNPLNDDLVVITYRDGLTSKVRRANTLRWEHLGQGDDIVAYELVNSDDFVFRSEDLA